MTRRLLAASLIALLPWAAGASENCTEDAMVVFDGSGSMAEMGFNQIGEPRIFEARTAMRRAVPGIAEARRLGLIIYGPGATGAGGCNSIDLRFDPQWEAAGLIINAVETLQPAGDTPLTEAVAAAADVLNYRVAPGAIVLITDGKETCGGAPCELAAVLASDAADLTVHVIGFKVRGDHFGWESQGRSDYNDAVTVARCLADRTGGKYVRAETLDDLVRALRVTLGCQVISQSTIRGAILR